MILHYHSIVEIVIRLRSLFRARLRQIDLSDVSGDLTTGIKQGVRDPVVTQSSSPSSSNGSASLLTIGRLSHPAQGTIFFWYPRHPLVRRIVITPHSNSTHLGQVVAQVATRLVGALLKLVLTAQAPRFQTVSHSDMKINVPFNIRSVLWLCIPWKQPRHYVWSKSKGINIFIHKSLQCFDDGNSFKEKNQS